MNKYSSIVRIEFDGNEFEADSKEEYIKKVILGFKEKFNIELDEHEIRNIFNITTQKFEVGSAAGYKWFKNSDLKEEEEQ